MLQPSIEAALRTDYAVLRSLFTRKIRDPALAEDLVSEAFLRSLEKLARNQLADPARFTGFVHGVAANLLRNHKRRMDNRNDLRVDPSVLESCAAQCSLEEELDRQAQVAAVREAVAVLPSARDREIARRLYFDGDSKLEVCRALGLSSASFDKIFYRLRQRMRAALIQVHALQHR